MIILDTDTVSLLNSGHPSVSTRALAATDEVVITIVSRIEILRGRWEFLIKAADGEQLQRAQHWMTWTEEKRKQLKTINIDAVAAEEFDRLRQDGRLKKIGRADLLIVAIALANRATLVSRNLRHFRLVPGLQVENWADE